MPLLTATKTAIAAHPGGGGAAMGAGDFTESAGAISFFEGTYEYSEPVTTLAATQLGAAQVNFQPINITPGGYLRGVTLSLTSASGVLGAGALSGDYPWNIYQNLELVSVDGTDLLYPMNGYSYFLVTKFTRPWDGDPSLDPFFVGTINAALRFRYFVESRMGIGVIPNTDARAQYRLNVSYNPSTVTFSTAPTTAPTVTTDIWLETYAQPDNNAYPGVEPYPPGMAMQREVSHQSGIAMAGGTQVIQSNRVGNQLRTQILVFRTSAAGNPRSDPSGDPIRWRLDNTNLLIEKRNRRDYEVSRFYQTSGLTTMPTRPTGVFVYPRWHQPGKMQGPSWLPTKTATYEAWEINDPSNTLAGGNCEIITEDLAPAGPIPGYLRDI